VNALPDSVHEHEHVHVLVHDAGLLRWAEVEPSAGLRAGLRKYDWTVRHADATFLASAMTMVAAEDAAMNERIEFVLRALLIGAGATLVMDAWALLLRQFGVPSLNFAFLGRWIGHLADGQWMHASIAKALPVRGESALGWCAHYAIGVSFAALLLATRGLEWARSPTLAPALLVGIVTVVAPLFVLQPALGAGIASTKTAAPVFNSLKSVMTHAVVGVGMYLAARGVVLAARVVG
jgi:hypothetical protein